MRVVIGMALLAACGGGEKDAAGDDTGSADTGPTFTPGTMTTPGTTTLEAPASCDLLLDHVGTYTVTGEPTEDPQRGVNTASHSRGTVTVAADLGIDFDDGVAFLPTDIVVCYDRTTQDFDRRIQVSYGADDSGEVINLYLDASLVVTEIQYRHSNAGENVRVLVTR